MRCATNLQNQDWRATFWSAPVPARVAEVERCAITARGISLPSQLQHGYTLAVARLTDNWNALGEPWQLAFDQAWQAFVDDCCPVGAVVLDDHGAVVALAHNRVRSDSTPPRELADTRIAHADVNAYAQIPTITQHVPAAVYTTIEPCLLCLGASLAMQVREIHFAASESFGGATSVRPLLTNLTDLFPSIDGPLTSEVGSLFKMLYVGYYCWINPAGPLAAYYKVNDARVYDRALQLTDIVEGLRANRGGLAEVLPEMEAKLGSNGWS